MWTSYFKDLSPEEAVRLFARKGWTHLEFSNAHARVLLDRPRPMEAGAEFGRFCADLGVDFPQGHLKLNAKLAMPDQAEQRAELDKLKRWIDLFAVLGIAAGVVHPGGAPLPQSALPSEEVFGRNVQSLAELTAHAAGGPTAMCLENGPNAGGLLRPIVAVGADNLGICLDTGHLALAREDAPEVAQTDYDFILEAGPHLKALHIADNDGSGDQHLLPLEGGKVDWEGVMRGLRDVGYEGLFNFEVPGEIRCSVQERLEKLDRARGIAERLLADGRL